MQETHIPVLLHEVLEGLHIQKNKKYIDATFGLGGHGVEIVKREGVVLGIETDPETIRMFNEQRTRPKADRPLDEMSKEQLTLVHGNFKNLREIAEKNGFTQVAGILFDLGYSSWQLDKSGRGFSFQKDEPLDMRLDKTQELAAAEVVNSYPIEQLEKIISMYGEEENALRIARRIVALRPIRTSGQLSKTIEDTVQTRDSRRNVARVFQAIRIEVNGELESLKEGLEQAIELLEPDGRIAVISFHSLEDRIVKFALINHTVKTITKKPITASYEEIEHNSRAKRAKLRIAEKL